VFIGIARNYRGLLLAAIVFLLLGASLIQSRFPWKTSPAVSSTVVISQVYGGGGNSGATLRNDFIELFNLGSTTADVSKWSVQYTSASGTSWQVTNLCAAGSTCSIAPGHYYLVQEAQGASGTTNLPTPDAIGSISMSASAAKIALVNNTTALSSACPLGGSVVDFVGYGNANCFEGTGAAGAPNNTTAEFRINNGCTDTDNNNADFATGLPNPRNSASASITCGVSPSPSPTPTPSPTPGCGVERWSVKTGTDADAALVGLSPQSTTIATMRSWPAPAAIPTNNRVSPYETTVWTVNATLVEYKLEDDSDYHIVIKDDAGNTMVTEIPYSGCVGSVSPFAASIANARAKFDAAFTATGTFQFANVPVQITGPGMFDFLHGQTGVAPNGIEIHPILDITINGTNAIDASSFFVRQHYLDFLNRDPDASGFGFWTNQINSCGAIQTCIDLKRINVSAAFFLSIEFQQTGFLVEQIYKTAYGDANGNSIIGSPHQLPVPIVRFTEFLPDAQEIGQGVVVGQTGWENVLENNKQAFANEFVQRPRFTNAFPTSITPTQFVDMLNGNAGNVLSASERATVIALFGSAPDTSNITARAGVLRQVAQDQDLSNAEFNRAFVLMQYFGYLRRNPNDAPDADYSGYDFWLTKLNQFNGNFVNAEMVKAFISSSEYRQRFGP
jgi:hypothetical protein